jgi:pyruvate dehydrogenase E2 component (dihydrolipoamide acetyltransferase)
MIVRKGYTMASQVVMPKMSDTMEEGVVVKWLKREGDLVQPGDALAEIETDKAVLELEAHHPGVLRKIFVQEDSKVPVGQLIALIGPAEEDIAPPTAGSAAPAAQPTPHPPMSPAEPLRYAPQLRERREAVQAMPRDVTTRERIDASPLARRMAEEAGIDIAQLRGTGPGGRVVKRDIEAFLAQYGPQVAPPRTAPRPQPSVAADVALRREERPPQALRGEDYEDHELSMMRKTIAKRMVLSKATAPHFYITAEIDMGPAMALRQSLNGLADDASKISVNDMVLKAAANALRQFPRVNVSYHEEKIRLHQRVHISMAVALDEGLITPVIRDCDRKSLGEVAREARELSERARARRLKPEEYTGGTFSVSNLGMFEVEDFGAILNSPEAAILAVGTIKEQPVVMDGQLAIGQRMRVTLSCDHRVVDGATAAQFLQIFKRLLEQPLRLML